MPDDHVADRRLICPGCGAPAVSDAISCGGCGRPLPIGPSPSTSSPSKSDSSTVDTHRFCPSCGTLATAGFSFCGTCGHLLTKDPAGTDGQKTPRSQVTSPSRLKAGDSLLRSQREPQPTASTIASPAYTQRRTSKAMRPIALSAFGAILMAVGTLLPWQIITSGGFTDYRSSFDLLNDSGASSSDGIWTLLPSIILVFGTFAIGVTFYRTQIVPRAIVRSCMVLAVISAVVLITDYPGVSQTVNDLNASGAGFRANVGYGYWACVLGAVAVIIGCIALLRSQRQ